MCCVAVLALGQSGCYQAAELPGRQEFVYAWVGAFCAHARACCDDAAFFDFAGRSDVEGCVRTQFGEYADMFRRSAAGDGIRYDPLAVDGCVAAIEASPCGVDPRFIDECRAVMVPQREIGQECGHEIECAVGTCGRSRTCEVPLSDGEPCVFGLEGPSCALGSGCDRVSAVCAPLPPLCEGT